MQRVLLLLLCAFWAAAGMAQPGLDCSNPVTINQSDLDDGNGMCVTLAGQDNTGATTWEVSPGLDFSAGCWGGSPPIIMFFSFTAQGVSGSVQVSNGPAGEDALVTVIHFDG